MKNPVGAGQESEMLKVMNAKLAGEPAWKLWILHQAARLLRVPIKVRGMPYGIADRRPIEQFGGWQECRNAPGFGAGFAPHGDEVSPVDQTAPDRTERALRLAEGLLRGTDAETLSEALARSDRRCVFQRPTERPGPADSTQ